MERKMGNFQEFTEKRNPRGSIAWYKKGFLKSVHCVFVVELSMNVLPALCINDPGD